MLGQRRRRWTNIKTALRQCIVFREVTGKDAMPQNTIKDLDGLRFWIQKQTEKSQQWMHSDWDFVHLKPENVL